MPTQKDINYKEIYLFVPFSVSAMYHGSCWLGIKVKIFSKSARTEQLGTFGEAAYIISLISCT